jgi:hypothetical protein
MGGVLMGDVLMGPFSCQVLFGHGARGNFDTPPWGRDPAAADQYVGMHPPARRLTEHVATEDFHGAVAGLNTPPSRQSAFGDGISAGRMMNARQIA